MGEFGRSFANSGGLRPLVVPLPPCTPAKAGVQMEDPVVQHTEAMTDPGHHQV